MKFGFWGLFAVDAVVAALLSALGSVIILISNPRWN
jgi:hypothetical protein